MKFLARLWFVVLSAGGFLLPAAALRADDAIPDHSPSGFVNFVFDAAKLEAAFSDKLEFFTNVMIAIAFLMIALPSSLGLIKRGLNPETITRFVVRPILLCAFIAITPDIKNAVSSGMNELGNKAGYNSADLVSKYYTETSVFDLEQTTHDLKESESTDDGLFHRLTELVSYIRNALHWVIQHVISIPFAISLTVLGIVTQIGILIGDFVRTSLIDVGYALLPVFIAAFNFGPMQHAAQNYVKRLFCLHLWPLAWSLVGVVTVTIVHLLHVYVSDVFYTATASGPSLAFTAANMFLVWSFLPIGTLAVIFLVMLIATCWQMYGLVKGPKMLNDIVVHGSLAFEGWWGPVLQQAIGTFAKTAGAAVAVAAAPVAAAAAPAVAGAAGAAGSAGAAGGVTSAVSAVAGKGAAVGVGGGSAGWSVGKTVWTGTRLMAQGFSEAMRDGYRRASRS